MDEFEDSLESPLLGSRVSGRSSAQSNGTYHSTTDSTTALPPSTVLEPPNVYRSRWRSLRVMYLTMFLGATTFTITMSSLWPFLQILQPSVDASFLGWVVASYSLGQLCASPLFGAWSTIRGSAREPLIVSLFMTTLANLFYTYLQSIPLDRPYFMILARGLIGFSAGNVAVVRSYVSGATTLKERTSANANLSIAQALGFILGPVIQAALVPIGYPGPLENEDFHFNLYTAPGFFATALATTNLCLLIFVFKEHRVYDEEVANIQAPKPGDVEGTLQSSTNNLVKGNIDTDQPLDYVAVFSNIFLFFIVLFMFTVMETIGTPITMHMFAWTKSQATMYQGIILGTGGAVSVVSFTVVKILAKKYNERYLLIFGLSMSMLGFFTWVPWGHEYPAIYIIPIQNNSHHNNSKPMNHSDISWMNVPSEMVLPDGFNVKYTNFVEDNLLINSVFEVDTNSGLHSKPTDYTSPFSQKNIPPYFPPTTTTTTREPNTTYVPSTTTAASSTTDVSSTTTDASSTTHVSPTTHPTPPTVPPEGCPSSFTWCESVPKISYVGYFLGVSFITIGYPMCNLLTFTIYSKILGPKPQGVWMGWLSASGSLARTVGPIYVSQVYDQFGPQITFGSVAGIIFLAIVFFLMMFRRLVPFTYKPKKLQAFGRSGDYNSIDDR